MIAQKVADRARMRVLIADDDPLVRAVLLDQLTALGHLVVAEAATGAEAVVRATALSPDVVLLDIHMPEGTGADAAALIARLKPAPGVVLYTGDASYMLPDDEVGSTDAVAVLPKSAPLALLESTMRCAAARAKTLSAARADATEAHRRLEERKLIERAKGILMRRTGSTEQEAYRILQRASQDRATPMIKIAKAVLDSEPGLRPHP